MSNIAKSPLRYPGGKSRALKQILPQIPPNISEFREPFVGGGSVFFAVRSIFQNLISYWINDLNYDLYCFWNQTCNNVDELVQTLQDTKANNNNGRVLFEELTQEKDALSQNRELLSGFDRAVRFFILNRITFSGIVDFRSY